MYNYKYIHVYIYMYIYVRRMKAAEFVEEIHARPLQSRGLGCIGIHTDLSIC